MVNYSLNISAANQLMEKLAFTIRKMDHIYAILSPRKSIKYFQCYFATINRIKASGQVPKWLIALKIGIIIRMMQLFAFQFVNLSASSKVYLVDYMYLFHMPKEFNIITLGLYLLIYLVNDQMFLRALTSDYGKVPYNVLIRKISQPYFISRRMHSTDKETLVDKFECLIVQMVNILQVSTVVSRK